MDQGFHIRVAEESDLKSVLSVERAAFATNEEAELTSDLLQDTTAHPLLSLIACSGQQAVGHILFTRASLVPDTGLSVTLLAPLAVHPDFQNRGIGGELIHTGLQLLKQQGVQLVFVLGHPGYYPRFGFEPAGRLGLNAPYEIPGEHADAWMVQILDDSLTDITKSTLVPAECIRAEHYWRE